MTYLRLLLAIINVNKLSDIESLVHQAVSNICLRTLCLILGYCHWELVLSIFSLKAVVAAIGTHISTHFFSTKADLALVMCTT